MTQTVPATCVLGPGKTGLAIGLTVDDVNEWPGRIRAVSADNVRRAAQSLSRNQAVTGYLLPGGAK